MRDAGLEAAENCLGVAAGLLVALPAAARAYLYVLPKGSELTAPAPTPVGKARFVLRAHDGSQHRSIRVGTYKAASWQAGDDVLFIMHGTPRNAEEYLDTWVGTADSKNTLLISLEFHNPFYRYVTNDYQGGNLFTALGFANPPSEWAYATIENIVDHLNAANGLSITGYDIFGHFAGGQFVQKNGDARSGLTDANRHRRQR